MWIQKLKICKFLKVKFTYKRGSASGETVCASSKQDTSYGTKIITFGNNIKIDYSKAARFYTCIKFKRRVILNTIKTFGGIRSANDCYSKAISSAGIEYWNWTRSTKKCDLMKMVFSQASGFVSGGERCS